MSQQVVIPPEIFYGHVQKLIDTWAAVSFYLNQKQDPFDSIVIVNGKASNGN
jgi:hypothetical protein